MARIGFGNWSLRTAGKGDARRSAYQPSDYTVTRRQRSRYTIRLWSVRHSRFLERVYGVLADVFLRLHPLWSMVGYGRVERPVKFVERNVKGFLFDCRMCGRCILSSTGMSCPMNCPKQLRNGPCGGVRADGHCEVIPERMCIWVQAWERSQRMGFYRNEIEIIQPPVNHAIEHTSSWINMYEGTDQVKFPRP